MIQDNWERGRQYEQYIGRWSRRVARDFLAWLHWSPGMRWLDVGCGTGALCSTVLDICSPAFIAGVEPSEGFLHLAKESLPDQIIFKKGLATEIPFEPDSFDRVISGLVLNFLPNPFAGLAEMMRVTRSGGKIGAYVWDYAGKMEFLRLFWDAAVEEYPEAKNLDEGARFIICSRAGLKQLFINVGLTEISIKAIDIQTTFNNFDDFWEPFLGSQGPAPSYVMSLGAQDRLKLRNLLKRRVPLQPDGSIHLTARAWAACGTVAGPAWP